MLGLCASRAYVDAHGLPETSEDLRAHTGIAFDEGDVYTGAGGFLERVLGGAHVV